MKHQFDSFEDVVAAVSSGAIELGAFEEDSEVLGESVTQITLRGQNTAALMDSKEMQTDLHKWLQKLKDRVEEYLISYYVNEYTPKAYHRTYQLSDSVRTTQIIPHDDMYVGEVYFEPSFVAGHSAGINKAICIDTGWCHRKWNGAEDHWHKFNGSFFVRRAIARFQKEYDGPFDLVIHVSHPDENIYPDTTLLGNEL